MWHAKRMHMDTRWGYRIPLRRCDKSLRATYRFTARSSTLHDASYTECIELQASPVLLLTLLNQHLRPAVDTQAAEQRRFCHAVDGTPVGPVRLLWHNNQHASPGSAQAWLFVHPSCAPDVHRALAASPGSAGVTIEHLRHQLLRFELRGPQSHAVLHHALHVDTACMTPGQTRAWRALPCMSNDMAPPGAVLGVHVIDPRLYPPSRLPHEQAQPGFTELMAGAQVSRVSLASPSSPHTW